MKLGRLAMAGLALCLFGSSAFAGNGSNFWHYTNGTDYFFGFLPPLPANSATWKCFPGALNHAPTRVVNPFDGQVGTYSSKIDALWYDVDGSWGGVLVLPYTSVFSGTATCAIATPTGAPQFLYFTGAGVGPVVGGPGAPAAPATPRFLTGLIAVSGAAPAPFINTLKLTILPTPGFPSAITIPEGDATMLGHPDPGVNPGTGFVNQYFIGSVDEHRVCSAAPNTGMFIPTAAGYFLISWFFNPSPIEWASSVSTIDSSVELATTTTTTLFAGPGGASGLNAHAGMGTPYHAGNQGILSMTGSTLLEAATGEIFGTNVYDANNAFAGGSFHLTCLNWSGLDPNSPLAGGLGVTIAGGFSGGFVASNLCPTAGGFGVIPIATGGPGGPALGPAVGGRFPRSVGKFDFVTNNLLANAIFLFATKHTVTVGGNNYPQYPAAALMGGSSGNNGGAFIAIPIVGALPGIEFCLWQLAMNAAGNALTPGAALGHSHTNSFPVMFAP